MLTHMPNVYSTMYVCKPHQFHDEYWRVNVIISFLFHFWWAIDFTHTSFMRSRWCVRWISKKWLDDDGTKKKTRTLHYRLRQPMEIIMKVRAIIRKMDPSACYKMEIAVIELLTPLPIYLCGSAVFLESLHSLVWIPHCW